jgi:membrane-bound serine protease (ClpP class)
MIWLGIVLLVIGAGLIVLEFFTGSGLLIATGIVLALIGSLVLIFWRSAMFLVDWWIIGLVCALLAAFIVFVIFRVRDTYRRQATTGKEDLQGKIAVVRETLNPEGTVLFQGELWNAVSISGKIPVDEEVVIIKISGLKLVVSSKEKS